MPYNYLILGAGTHRKGMGGAIAYDCLKHGDAGKVTIADSCASNLGKLESRLNDKRVNTVVADVSYTPDMTRLMHDYDVAISAVPYDLNYDLMRAAIASGTHFCDLGGNNTVVQKQFAMDRVARESNLKVMPDCGIAPGAVSIIARYGIEKFLNERGKMPDYVKIRVGGIPQEKEEPLDYANAFSIHGLINEYVEEVEVLRNGKIATVEPLTGLEKQLFEGTFGTLEAAYTSGGSSTLTRTYEGRIKNIDYKTLRHPGHWKKMQLLKKLGLLESRPLNVSNTEVDKRMFTEALLNEVLPKEFRDSMVVRILVGDRKLKIGFDMIKDYDDTTCHTAMQQTTGYSAAIIAQMMVTNHIRAVGVLTQEGAVPPGKFLEEWAKRGMHLEEFRNDATSYDSY